MGICLDGRSWGFHGTIFLLFWVFDIFMIVSDDDNNEVTLGRDTMGQSRSSYLNISSKEGHIYWLL